VIPGAEVRLGELVRTLRGPRTAAHGGDDGGLEPDRAITELLRKELAS
jgi:hypothetical protein